MSTLEWLLQAVLVLALAAAIPFSVRLERALSVLRRDRAALNDSARGFSDAISEAEAAIARLRATADSASRTIAGQIAAAGPVGDDLRFLIERAEAQADRLDAAVRSTRPVTGPVEDGRTASPAGVTRDKAERDLLRAIRGTPG